LIKQGRLQAFRLGAGQGGVRIHAASVERLTRPAPVEPATPPPAPVPKAEKPKRPATKVRRFEDRDWLPLPGGCGP